MKANPVTRARALVGARFRAQGRTEKEGFDCLGLMLEAFGIPETAVRRDYRLRGAHEAELLRGASRWFRPIAGRDIRYGDLLLCRSGTHQLHLAIKSESGFIHADARHRRVVETPGDVPWPLVAAMRLKKGTD